MAESSPSVQDLSAIDALSHVFNIVLSQKPQTALGAAAYYINYIKYFPTNFEKILKVVKGDLPKFSASRLRLGRRQLLIDGLIAQMLPMIDYETPIFKREFGRELLIPIDPKAVWDFHKDRLDKTYINGPGMAKDLDDYFNNLSDMYIRNFSPVNLYKKLDQCLEECNMPLNYSSPWILYSLLSGSNKGTSVRAMMGGGARAFDAFHRGYYEGILKKGATIDILLGRREQRQLSYIGYLKEKYEDSLHIRYTPIESYGTNRVAILDDIFALDARKMLPSTKSEPSYIGTLYFDDDCLSSIKGNFEDMWAMSHEISLRDTRDVKPAWWNPIKTRYPLRW
jgi:hypothetical protein